MYIIVCARVHKECLRRLNDTSCVYQIKIKSNHVYCETDDPIHIIIMRFLATLQWWGFCFHPQTRQLAWVFASFGAPAHG
jgi:hypothetical protein